jgi:hypothetical protein
MRMRAIIQMGRPPSFASAVASDCGVSSVVVFGSSVIVEVVAVASVVVEAVDVVGSSVVVEVVGSSVVVEVFGSSVVVVGGTLNP